MKDLFIFGAGETGAIVCEYFRLSGRAVSGFIADDEPPPFSHGLPVVPWDTFIEQKTPRDAEVFVAISYQSMNKVRRSKFQKVRNEGFDMPAFIHPSASVAEDALLGRNCLVLENCVLQKGASLGDDVHIWSGSHIGHGVAVGSHTFVSSHVVLAGHSKIGDESFLGANSSVRESVQLGKSCLVGIGAVALRSLPDNSSVIQTGSIDILPDDPRSRIVRRSIEGP